MKKTVLIIAAVVAAALLVFGGVKAYNMYYDRKVGNFSKVSELYVYPDTTPEELVKYIIDSCGTLKPKSLLRAFEEQSEFGSIMPGHYNIDTNSTSASVARTVYNGWQTPVKLVLSGTMRRHDGIARKISAQMMLDSMAVINALTDPELLAGYGFTTDNVYALFMPDTYEVYWTDSMKDILDKQKAAYDAFWTPENLRKAEAQGLTKMEVSILASIVKGETNYEPEMPCIAGVYLNRMKKRMKLQADPTIAYCYNYEVNRILKKHLKVDSPFNTYKHFGLPPAPIAVPTRACLEAVLNPDTHGYLYFCASPDFNGSHLFAASYSEHLKNARAFHRALNARNKAKK